MSNIIEKSRTLVLTRGFVLGALLAVGALLTAVGAAQQTPSAASIQVDKVRDNLYVLRGGLGNTVTFITAKGVMLVDLTDGGALPLRVLDFGDQVHLTIDLDGRTRPGSSFADNER